MISKTVCNGTIQLVKGEISLSGNPPFCLPREMTPEFVQKLFSIDRNEQFFIADLASDIVSDEKRRLRSACRSMGGNIWRLYQEQACKWASVANSDNLWHVDKLVPIYDEYIGSYSIDRLIIFNTKPLLRVITHDSAIFSFDEFERIYGITVHEHILDYIKSETLRLSFIANTTGAIEGVEVIKKTVLVINHQGHVEKLTVEGLNSVPPKYWPSLNNLIFLDVA